MRKLGVGIDSCHRTLLASISDGRHRAWIVGWGALLLAGTAAVPRGVFDRYGAGSIVLRRFSRHASELDYDAIGGGDFGTASADAFAGICISRLQPDS